MLNVNIIMYRANFLRTKKERKSIADRQAHFSPNQKDLLCGLICCFFICLCVPGGGERTKSNCDAGLSKIGGSRNTEKSLTHAAVSRSTKKEEEITHHSMSMCPNTRTHLYH